jgi:hypothetical protein
MKYNISCCVNICKLCGKNANLKLVTNLNNVYKFSSYLIKTQCASITKKNPVKVVMEIILVYLRNPSTFSADRIYNYLLFKNVVNKVTTLKDYSSN